MTSPAPAPEQADDDGPTKVCPVCGETIKAAAIKCRFCNTDLEAFAKEKDALVEHTIFKGHPAIIFHLSQFLVFLISIGIAFVLFWARGRFDVRDLIKGQSDAVYLAIEWSMILFLPVVAVIRYWLKSLSTTFEITTQRVRIERGFLSTDKDTLELFRIDHFEIHKPIGQRIMGYCELHLSSSDKSFETVVLYGIHGLEALADRMRECSLHERARRQVTTFVQA